MCRPPPQFAVALAVILLFAECSPLHTVQSSLRTNNRRATVHSSHLLVSVHRTCRTPAGTVTTLPAPVHAVLSPVRPMLLLSFAMRFLSGIQVDQVRPTIFAAVHNNRCFLCLRYQADTPQRVLLECPVFCFTHLCYIHLLSPSLICRMRSLWNTGSTYPAAQRTLFPQQIRSTTF